MALTRKMLSGMGLTAEQVDAIIEEHISVTDSLKAERDKYKEEAEKLPTIQKELNDLKKDVADNDWKGKYDKEHSDFDKFKKDTESKETLTKIKDAYKKLLVSSKVGDKQIDAIMKVTDFSDMKLAEDGSLEGADKLQENITSTWSGFITSKETKGADVETPPASGNNNASGKTGRAAQLAEQYNNNLYGKLKED